MGLVRENRYNGQPQIERGNRLTRTPFYFSVISGNAQSIPAAPHQKNLVTFKT